MKRLTLTATITALALTLGACSSSGSADAPVKPLDDAGEKLAMERFSTFKDDLKSLRSYHATGTVDADDGTQTTDFTFDRQKDAFKGAASIDSGSLDLSIELIRTSGLLWIKGPEEYWESFGYDATPALGKYVVFQAAQGDQIAKTYDYDRLVSTVESMSTGEVTVEGEVEVKDSESIRYMLGEEGRSTLLDLPAGGDISTATLVSRADDVDATIVIDEFDVETDVSAPDPDEVTQPQGS
ncbi:hypothetical protein [Brevibacterium oceani]|uniref:hypothetical protein n=1 Tax=Brevibacterium oceani TaxID=358099 RepID=UPI0015E67E7A|nr:hypothetical protein [Brevibacterium oceani]